MEIVKLIEFVPSPSCPYLESKYTIISDYKTKKT